MQDSRFFLEGKGKDKETNLSGVPSGEMHTAQTEMELARNMRQQIARHIDIVCDDTDVQTRAHLVQRLNGVQGHRSVYTHTELSDEISTRDYSKRRHTFL